MSRPIVIYSYNRPHYFTHVISSLANQTGDSEIFLFQDGPVNSEDKILTDRSVEIFQNAFPEGNVFYSNENLGVAFNQKRAREFIFERSDSAIFIEDDIVLNDGYILLLNGLMNLFSKDDSIGMVSCFGESHRHPEVFKYFEYLVPDEDWNIQQEKNKNHFMQMEHLWAYGFFRNAYEKVKDEMENYYALIPKEYWRRPHVEILKYAMNLGLDPTKVVSSQDSVLSGILVLNNIYKVSTFTMNAKYIGEVGVHATPEHYAQYWADVTPYGSFESNYVWNNQVKQRLINMCRHKYIGNC